MPPEATAVLQAPDAPPAAVPPRRGRVRITPNLFGIPFGLAGLAEAWAAAARSADLAVWPSDAIWVLAGAAWVVVLSGYLVNARSRLSDELADPIFAPFLSLAVITPMLLGVALSDHADGPGQVLAFVCLALTVLLGGWLTGSWIINDMPLARWHPGYFLPTVAGGLLGSSVAAELGHRDLAELLFGYGMVCWLVLGSILLTRLFTQPLLPTPLLPTIAIEVAPPVVAGNAWFLLNGGRVDAVALGLAG
jgi:tellurite resistance protein